MNILNKLINIFQSNNEFKSNLLLNQSNNKFKSNLLLKNIKFNKLFLVESINDKSKNYRYQQKYSLAAILNLKDYNNGNELMNLNPREIITEPDRYYAGGSNPICRLRIKYLGKDSEVRVDGRTTRTGSSLLSNEMLLIIQRETIDFVTINNFITFPGLIKSLNNVNLIPIEFPYDLNAKKLIDTNQDNVINFLKNDDDTYSPSTEIIQTFHSAYDFTNVEEKNSFRDTINEIKLEGKYGTKNND